MECTREKIKGWSLKQTAFTKDQRSLRHKGFDNGWEGQERSEAEDWLQGGGKLMYVADKEMCCLYFMCCCEYASNGSPKYAYLK